MSLVCSQDPLEKRISTGPSWLKNGQLKKIDKTVLTISGKDGGGLVFIGVSAVAVHCGMIVFIGVFFNSGLL